MNVLTFWGFGMASERMSKRIRDLAFAAMMRQEPAFFDKRSVASVAAHSRVQRRTGPAILDRSGICFHGSGFVAYESRILTPPITLAITFLTTCP